MMLYADAQTACSISVAVCYLFFSRYPHSSWAQWCNPVQSRVALYALSQLVTLRTVIETNYVQQNATDVRWGASNLTIGRNSWIATSNAALVE